MPSTRIRWFIVPALLAGCTSSPDPAARPQALTSAGARSDFRIAWGSGVDQVGLQPAGPWQAPAQGPAAVAVDRAGRVLILDQLNRRVLRVGADGAVKLAATTEADGQALAAGDDGAIAVYSPLRSRVWIYAGGEPAGELAVPRELRTIRSIALRASRRVEVQNEYQESFTVGSPSLPQTLATVLTSKREGAAFVGPAGLAVLRRADGHPEVLLLGAGERASVLARHALDEQVLAVELVGASGALACLRLELPTPAAPPVFKVSRRAVCIDATTGARVFSADLPGPGLYLPRQELALGGGDAPRLAFASPEDNGLHLTLWSLPARRQP